MNKENLQILILLLTTLFCVSCIQEDDIDEIFTGKTWYMNGGTINGMRLNSDVKNFYTDAGMNAYYITFTTNRFQGVLSAGTSFSGVWSANGKHQTITLEMTSSPELSTPFDKQIYNILSSVTSYRSGANFLQLKEDGQNEVVFGNTR